MSVTSTTATYATEVGGNLSGTPIIFYPVPTPWPSQTGCDKYLYRQEDGGTILGFDPVYPQRFGVKEARRCYPKQLGSWWWQDYTRRDATLQTAFGPTFVCPEAYTAVYTSTLDSSASAAQTEFTYCCPRDYSLGAILPPTERHAMQCTSEAKPGETISYMSRSSVTRTVTVTGSDGTSDKVTVQSTNFPSSTVVKSYTATIYAIPINGFNIFQQKQPSSGTEVTSSTAEATSLLSTTDAPVQSSSPALSPGAIAGISVGAAIGTGLLALGAFLVWKRRTANRQRAAAVEEEAAKYNYHYQEAAELRIEMPVKNHVHELSHFKSVQELPP